MSSSWSSSTTESNLTTPTPSHLILTPLSHLQIKLTKDNYLSWKTAITPSINGNKIIHHIDGTTTTPSQFISSPTSPTILIPNPVYALRFAIDQLLFSVLVSTISDSLISSIVGLSTARDV